MHVGTRLVQDQIEILHACHDLSKPSQIRTGVSGLMKQAPEACVFHRTTQREPFNNLLGTVAKMLVAVEDHHPLRKSLGEEFRGSDGEPVEGAESATRVVVSMMEPANGRTRH